MRLTQNTESTTYNNTSSFNPTDLLRQKKQEELYKLFDIGAINTKKRAN